MLLPQYSSLFEILNKNDISFCLLRDECRDLEEGKLLKDLDILLADDKFEYAIQLLQDNGYKIKNTERLNPYKTVLIKYVEGKIFLLDLHRRLVYHGLIYLSHENILKNSRKMGDYFLPSDTDLLLILLFHNIIGKSTIQDKHYEKIINLSKSIDREYAARVLSRYGTDKIFFNIITRLEELKKDQDKLLNIRHDIFMSIYKKNIPSWFQVRYLKIKKYFYYKFNRLGLLITCLGVDGAGKSTMAHELAKVFNQNNCFRASVQYMGPWGHYHFKVLNNCLYNSKQFLTTREFISKIFSKKYSRVGIFEILKISYKQIAGLNMTEDEIRNHSIMRNDSRIYLFMRYIRSLISTTFFFVLLTIEMYTRYLKIYRKLRFGQIVVTDRYIYDLMVGAMHEVGQTHKRFRSFLCKMFFKPDIVFLLRNSPEEILMRKNDLTKTNLIAIQEIYDQMSNRYEFINIITDKKQSVLAREAIEANFDKIIDTLKM
ncbi:MAG: hypothetical protein AMK71_00295 [Nitrospira bacterium SG8_35_4]|nr:MAG: hypothetical protein AMK71_00295 [Nitrospira bacterium SG8_35_4]